MTFEPARYWTRREFLRLAGQAGAAATLPLLTEASASFAAETVTVSLLHTTDLHGHILPTSDYDGTPQMGGLARCVSQIRRWRRKNPNTILIDAGDIYQGTDVALRTRGRLMIDLLNHLRYDAWVIGNHEFDWGMEPFLDALRSSHMPVLAANLSAEGKLAGTIIDRQNPYAKIQPYIVKEVGGIKIAIIGITTPGMPFWFRPEFLRDLEFLYPIEPVRRAMVQARSDGANAIVLVGHMGLKARSGGDDFANNVIALTSEFPEAAVFIAGHTHQLIGSRTINNVLVTQADHFGIHAGRVDLLFDRASKRLLGRESRCERMDERFRLDHVVLSRAKRELAESSAALAEPIGELAETLRVDRTGDEPSDVERLIGAAIVESLRERSIGADGAFHGLFDDTKNLSAGPKTVEDVWQVLPFENFVVTAELSYDQLKMIMEESYASHEQRSLLGFRIKSEGRGANRRVVSIARQDGRPIERAEKFRVAFNTFDSRSAGHRFMKLRELLEKSAVNCQFHNLQTRDALIDYFRRHKVVHRIASETVWPAAA